jgi:hypothetical protein
MQAKPIMPRDHRTSKEEFPLAEAQRLRQQGQSLKAIAATIGWSFAQVRRKLLAADEEHLTSTPVTSTNTTITVSDAELSAHPLANLFPLMNEADFTALRDDIAAQGLLEPLWLYEGQILDGRNRYKACKALGIQPQVRTYQGSDPLGFVLSMNLVRRHLNESQRALVAADVATMRQGERTDLEPSANLQKVSQAKASELFNISARSVSDAKRVKMAAQPEVVNAVRDGHLAVSAAAKLAQEPGPVQREVAAKMVSGEASTVTQALKQMKGGETPTESDLQADLKQLRRLWEQMMRRWRTEADPRMILANLNNLTREIRHSLGLDKDGDAHD